MTLNEIKKFHTILRQLTQEEVLQLYLHTFGIKTQEFVNQVRKATKEELIDALLERT